MSKAPGAAARRHGGLADAVHAACLGIGRVALEMKKQGPFVDVIKPFIGLKK
jgi:hypothetical protein